MINNLHFMNSGKKSTETVPFLDSVRNDLPKLNYIGPKIWGKSPIELKRMESLSEVQTKCLLFIYSQTHTYSRSKLGIQYYCNEPKIL